MIHGSPQFRDWAPPWPYPSDPLPLHGAGVSVWMRTVLTHTPQCAILCIQWEVWLHHGLAERRWGPYCNSITQFKRLSSRMLYPGWITVDFMVNSGWELSEKSIKRLTELWFYHIMRGLETDWWGACGAKSNSTTASRPCYRAIFTLSNMPNNLWYYRYFWYYFTVFHCSLLLEFERLYVFPTPFVLYSFYCAFAYIITLC